MSIVSGLIGGLGNQLFQYAFGYALSRVKNDRFYIDITGFMHQHRKFELDAFNISARIISVNPIIKDERVYRILAGLVRLSKTGFSKTILNEDSANYNKFAYKNIMYKRSIYLSGYWQNWRYFNQYRDELLVEFSPKSGFISKEARDMIQQVSSENSAAIHIRRGDYLNLDGWLINPIYYLKAIEQMEYKKGKRLNYFVFCEDTHFADNLLQGSNYQLITRGNYISDFEEFLVMTACSNHIISNSSYSWWAAYLHSNPINHTVIAPMYKQWVREYYLPEWICIEAEQPEM